MNFLKTILVNIPEGRVAKITRKSDGKVLWEKKKYAIRDTGGDIIKRVTMSDFRKMLGDGVLNTSPYGIGTQLIIPYEDPFDGREYVCPFNFGTFRTFTKEDGTTFSGLGLCAEYALPTGGAQFDAPEPGNSSDARKNNGNNRWMHSNVRQWMNATGLNWYTAQHEYDVPPTTPDPATVHGLIDCFPSDFIDALRPVAEKTKTCNYDGGEVDTTYDTFFLLSLREKNCGCTDSSVSINDDTEGTYWEYWRQKTGSSGYLTGGYRTGGFGSGGLDANEARIVYSIKDHTTAVRNHMRTCRLAYEGSIIGHHITGGFTVAISAYAQFMFCPACAVEPA